MDVKDLTLAHVKSHLQASEPSTLRQIEAVVHRSIPYFFVFFSIGLLPLFFFLLLFMDNERGPL
jgi:hypothetical protein